MRRYGIGMCFNFKMCFSFWQVLLQSLVRQAQVEGVEERSFWQEPLCRLQVRKLPFHVAASGGDRPKLSCPEERLRHQHVEAALWRLQAPPSNPRPGQKQVQGVSMCQVHK